MEWPVLNPTDPVLHTWTIPGANRRITLRGDAVGFILVWFITYFNDLVERLDPPGKETVDEAGYNHRYIANTRVWSQHARAAAADLNWQRHPFNTSTRSTFTRKQIDLIHKRMKLINRLALGNKLVEWGGDWPSWSGSTAKTDSMHFEINRIRESIINGVVAVIVKTPRGRRIIKANPNHRRYRRVHV
jgi:hypothetical protein